MVSASGSLRLSRNISLESLASCAKELFIIGMRATGFGEISRKVRKPSSNCLPVASANQTGWRVQRRKYSASWTVSPTP